MSLVEYRRKRQFARTREPEPGTPLADAARAIFVVQLHHASHRHYDFRLQVGDTLKSWAVPKGPSYDPSVKRMAVEVEDHPVAYAAFEGEIPHGQYGGGHVALFDTGVWSTPFEVEAQLAKGHLRFELFGDKLKGEWHLVRSGKAARQPQWLLFKEKDEYASDLEADDLLADVSPPPDSDALRAGSGKAAKKKHGTVAAARPGRRVDWAKKALKLQGAKKQALRDAAFEPQLATRADKPPEGGQWLHELKWDGYRLVTTIVEGVVRIWSRNGLEWSDKVPEIRSALQQLHLDSAALDGELIAGKGTQADFGLLQATLSGEKQGSLAYVLFDLLHVNGVAIDQAPLLERKALLAELLRTPPRHLALSSHIPGEPQAAFDLASAKEFEGIISKRSDQPYHAGRSEDWRKTKRLHSEEYAVVGYMPGKGSRTGFGSLLLARPDGDHGWVYAGRVGSGFSDLQLRSIAARIGAAGGKQPTAQLPAAQDTDLRLARWFEPMFVVEVIARGISNQGLLRQPSLKTLRPDKTPSDLSPSDLSPSVLSPVGAASAAIPPKSRTRRSKSPPAEGIARVALPPAQHTRAPKPAPLKLTSPTKIIYPDAGITKQQVADYYLAVMPWLLPEISGRPLSVIRCPSGTSKPCFFQKHHTAGLEKVDLVRLTEETGENANYLVANDAEGVMELVQFNALEFHPWGARADDPDRADRIVFDLDPGPDVAFDEVKRSAAQVRDLLARLELKSFLRTTGGKGLHVVVPLNPGCDWGLAKRFAKGFAESLAQSEPERYLAVSTLKLRRGKIFIDYLRNGRGATAVASYSLRARPGAPVAMPLPWSGLARLKRGDAFTLSDVPRLLAARRTDPWDGIGEIEQDLGRWAV